MMADENKEKEFEGANDWEASRILMIEKSERRAWNVAKGMAVLAALSILAIAMMMPLKDVVPYVLRVDDATGVPDLLTAMDMDKIEYEEARDMYWLNKYVQSRETYDWYTIQRDYNRVGLLSSREIGQEYAAIYTGKDALDKRYGSKIKATIRVISVVPDKGVGTVRFIKTTQRVDDPNSAVETRWIATIAYKYTKPSVMLNTDRLVNPFGFQVTSFRVDPEMEVRK
jgi:type IV secretion system protein VirB8